ncbi:MAG: hypothetical protein HY000_09285 [Planctomycetes bacterium]|nr:hypothetical protein [Planctomycetota bacterium]
METASEECEPQQIWEFQFMSRLAAKRKIECRHMAPEPFLIRAHRLDQRGRTDAALDLIYDSVDEFLRTSEFERLDLILANVAVAKLSVDILLGILTATLPAKSRLPSRAKLFKCIEQELKTRGRYEQGLLIGLEP